MLKLLYKEWTMQASPSSSFAGAGDNGHVEKDRANNKQNGNRYNGEARVSSFRRKRHIVYLILTFLLLIIPFIRIGDARNHVFLLSFDHKVLHLLGIEYSIQEFYVMTFMLMILFVGIFLMTVMAGRLWCGWLCPQTIFRSVYRDIIQTQLLKLRKKITNKQEILKLDTPAKQIKYGIGILLFLCISLIASADFLFFFVPPEDFFAYARNFEEHGILLGFWLVIAIFMTIEVCFIAEKFCIYMCPYARVQSVFFDDDTLMSIYDTKRGGLIYNPSGTAIGISPKKQDKNNECTNCQNCVKVCPTHIDIRKGVQLECIHCLECVDACSDVMAKFNRPSLVTWSSPNAMEQKGKPKLLRSKTIAYMIILTIIFALLIIVGKTHKSMLLNITRESELYIVRDSGAIDNVYKFVVQNVDREPHRFAFELDGDMADKFEIIMPDYGDKKDFLIEPNDAKFLVVLLRAKGVYNDSINYDKHVPIRIKSYAIDNKDGISTTSDTIFIYPRKAIIDEKLSKKH